MRAVHERARGRARSSRCTIRFVRVRACVEARRGPAPSTSTSTLGPDLRAAPSRGRSPPGASTQPVEPLLDDLLRDLIGHRGRSRPGPRRVLERVRRIEPRPLDDVEGLREVLLGLAREPHDDVGRDRDLRDRLPDRVQPPEVALAPVGALHRLQDAVRARLQREVDVLADLLALRHRLDHVGREVVRVRGREPDPPEPVHLVHLRGGAPRRAAGATTPARSRRARRCSRSARAA